MVRPYEDHFFNRVIFQQVAHKGVGSPIKPPYKLEDLKNWRLVELVGSFDPVQNEAGGAFILRNHDHAPLLARAFPIVSGPLVYTEAVAVRRAVESMVASDETNLFFCTSSLALLRCFYNGETTGSKGADGVIRESIKWFHQAPGFRLVHVHEEEVVAARWLACTGGRCKQHIQWDRPLMLEMLGELEP